MFTILGADGKEYGPVPEGRIHEWINGGRANRLTRARRDGETEWKALGDFPEFALTAPAGEPPSVPVAPTFTPSTFSPAPAAGPALELADRGTRLGAFLLDRLAGLLAIVPGLLVLGPSFFKLMIEASRGREPDLSGIQAGGFLVGLLLVVCGALGLFIVQVVMLSTRGQTIGKRLLGIRVVRHPDNAPAGFVHGWLLRNFVPGIIQVLPWVGFAFFLVDACFIFRDDQRCIHDLMASTRVVKA